jgi:pyruvate ferredoxin oxidoreductase beta subunit
MVTGPVTHEIKSLKDIPDEGLVTGGSPLCGGCPASLGIKMVVEALGRDVFVVNASGCMTLFVTYPHTPLSVSWIHVAIENAAAAATGLCSALKAMGKKATVVCYAGDGATYDIGFQALSGAVDRGDDFVYVCYNNQSFGNTGIQRSAATPYGAFTTTTPTGKVNRIGNMWRRKPMAKILAVHGIPYAATACVSYPADFMNKLRRAAAVEGPAFIDLLAPCPTGWGFDSSKTVEMGRLAVQTGMWPLYEFRGGKFSLSMAPEGLKPVTDYLSQQKRFRHLPENEVQKIQKWVSDDWTALRAGKWWEARS